MDKLPFKYKVAQLVADNYVFLLFISYILGIATGVWIEIIMLSSSNG